LRQKLVTKKNRKVRRLVEMYPGTQVKILYQRDYLNLLVKYGLESPDQLHGYRDCTPAAESSGSLLGLGTFRHPSGSRGAA
jgi:hypoxanthine phosphoribosyltransferase